MSTSLMQGLVFLQSSHAGCKGFRNFLLELSAQPGLRNVVFAEVDLELQALRVSLLSSQLRKLQPASNSCLLSLENAAWQIKGSTAG